ncbi:venom allergen 5.02-like [Galleria mellonella]|uniref:Venom allergen 5.02-like n=1 Tax=Galleria mellonella TaxID=7137 RepID=A0ABM3MD57_GALME|nr:venom allergen 5.02-like [Galleria mellonella]
MAIRVVLLLSLLVYAQCKILELTCDHVREFVDGHNSRRLALAKGEVPAQPAASTMNLMVWDDELAAKATKWASQNSFAHNSDKKIGSGRFTTGENIFMFSTTSHAVKLNVESVLNGWFNEYEHYTYGRLLKDKKPDKVQTGHYTQMVWSNSTYLGCGVSLFSKSGWMSYIVVCNYGPAGNIIGSVPYKSGKPSSSLKCAMKDCSSVYGDKCSFKN